MCPGGGVLTSVIPIMLSPSPRLWTRIFFTPRKSVFAKQTRAFHATVSVMSAPSTSSPALAPMTQFSVSLPATPSPSPADVAAKSHHRKDGKGFQNPWPSFTNMQLSQIAKWMIVGGLTGSRKKVDLQGALPPVHTPTFLPTRHNSTTTTTTELRVTWLGHASYFVEFPGGLRVLTDPVFTPRCSPFAAAGPTRYTAAPCQVADLPAALDVVVISHNHYDHLSHPTIQAIVARYPHVRFFVPAGVKAWFAQNFDAGVAARVTELDWWEEREVTLSTPASASASASSASSTSSPKARGDAAGENEADRELITARFGCLPAQHMTARGMFDRYQTLWASWAIESGGKKLWFAGDTGYRSVSDQVVTASAGREHGDYDAAHAALPTCPAFKQIGELRGPFDLGLIPIGAYAPRFLMSCVHANPYDAVNIFLDTRCRRAVAMHWGTWVLTEEPVLEPPRLLKKALKWKGLDEEGVFDVMDIGASRTF